MLVPFVLLAATVLLLLLALPRLQDEQSALPERQHTDRLRLSLRRRRMR